jgi:hypothetical protein
MDGWMVLRQYLNGWTEFIHNTYPKVYPSPVSSPRIRTVQGKKRKTGGRERKKTIQMGLKTQNADFLENGFNNFD